MKISQRYEFRPGLWPSAATLILLPLLLALGFWQLDRAEQKARMQAGFSAGYERPTAALNDLVGTKQEDALLWRPVTASGEYARHSYLLDNQVWRGEPGYRLYTPLRLEAGNQAFLVERDWLAMGPDRDHVPRFVTPSGKVHVRGRVVPPPSTGIMLGEHRLEELAAGLYRVQRIQPQELAAHSGLELFPWVVRLDSARPTGDDKAAALGGFDRERHLGYAFQWFALALTLVIIYLVVNIRRRRQSDE